MKTKYNHQLFVPNFHQAQIKPPTLIGNTYYIGEKLKSISTN